MTQEHATVSEEAGPTATRAGYVALVGLPNAGKSSLLNRLLDQKLSIVTPLAQTTRERVVGIETRDGVQMVFLDTPGLVDPGYLLHQSMLYTAVQTIPDADVVLLLVDPVAGPPKLNDEVLGLLKRRRASVLVVINKTDIAKPEQLARVRDWSAETLPSSKMISVSALTGAGVGQLWQEIADRLPESPYFYPPDEISSQPVRFFVAELVRETAFELFQQEIPYSVAVRVEEFRESATPIFIRAVIFVERASQKGILIGRGGEAIKRLGATSRRKIEEFVGAPVYLDLWIKVLPKWRKDPNSLRNLGFTVPPSDT